MAKTFDEGFLRFEFGEKWVVEKYDDHADYVTKIRKLHETKAVDFVAIYASNSIFFIEVKDYRGRNKKRLRNGEIAMDVAVKVRDSIAGVIGAHRTSSTPETWHSFARGIQNRNMKFNIVFWLEEEIHADPSKALALENEIQNLLRPWLGARIYVVNQRNSRRPPDLKVINLPGAGQP